MVAAPNTPGLYEFVKATGTFVALTPYETAGGAVVGGPLTPVYDVVAPGAPTAPYSLALMSKTSTSVTVSWAEDPDPTIGGQQLYLDGVASGAVKAPDVRSATISGLAAASTHKVTVTRSSSTGQESPPSNVLTVTTNAATVGVPTAPSTLAASGVTDNSAVLTWTETTDASVTSHQVYVNGVKSGAALGAGATSATVTALAQKTAYTAWVTRTNAAGESAPSPTVSFTTKASVATTVTHDPVTGVSYNNQSNLIPTCPVVRVYNYSAAAGAVSQFGARIISLTDDTSVAIEGGAASATALDNFLAGFYGAGAHAGVEVHVANGNEVDKHYLSGALPTAYVDTHKAMYNVVHSVDSTGKRKYPKASMWVDMTQFHLSTYGTGPRFKTIAPYLDGMACSMYPPGRKQQPTRFDAYSAYCDVALNTIVDWNATYPTCKGFATWEVGIPIDHPTAWGTAAGGEPTAQTVFSIRPRYMTGGVDSAGTDWKGFLQYVYDFLNAAGVEMHEQIYWDQQVANPYGPPNQFSHDQGSTRAVPSTATAWKNWTPGTRLVNG